MVWIALLCMIFIIFPVLLIGALLILGLQETDGSHQHIVEFLGKQPSRKNRTTKIIPSLEMTEEDEDDIPDKDLNPPTDGPIAIKTILKGIGKIVNGYYLNIPLLHEKVASINITSQILNFVQPEGSEIDVLGGAIRVKTRVSFIVTNVARAFYNVSSDTVEAVDNPGDYGYYRELESLIDAVTREVLGRHTPVSIQNSSGEDAEDEIAGDEGDLESENSKDIEVWEIGDILVNRSKLADEICQSLNSEERELPRKPEYFGIHVFSIEVVDVIPSKQILDAREQEFIADKERAVRVIEARGIAQSAQILIDQGMEPSEAQKAILSLRYIQDVQGNLNLTTFGGNIQDLFRSLTGGN
jgi:regulator of protease activity HflC (stomatin/prohibitin superfamily)